MTSVKDNHKQNSTTVSPTDTFLRDIRTQHADLNQKKLNVSSSSKNLVRYSNLGGSELSIGKSSDISKDYLELTNEIKNFVQQPTNERNNDISNGGSKNTSAIGVTFNDETWVNNNKEPDNSESFEVRIKEIKRINEMKLKAMNKERKINMIYNASKKTDPLIEQCLRYKKEKDKEMEFENIDEINNEDCVPTENLNHLSAEKQNIKKFFINTNSEEEKRDLNNTPSFKESNKNQWINYPARKPQFSTTTSYNDHLENYYSYLKNDINNQQRDVAFTNDTAIDNKKFSFAGNNSEFNGNTFNNIQGNFSSLPLFKQDNYIGQQSQFNFPMNQINQQFNQFTISSQNQFIPNSQINNVSLNMNINFNTNINNIKPYIPSSISNQNKKKKSEDINFNINIDNILSSQDTRTTIMIRNIPNKYDLQLLLEEVNEQFRGKYDFFYLPLDFENLCNLGYAFINFIEPMHILYFLDLFHGKKWKKFKSNKECALFFSISVHFDHFEQGKRKSGPSSCLDSRTVGVTR